MTDPELPPMDDDVRALVERAANVPGPPEGSRLRVWAGVEAIVGSPGGGGPWGGTRGPSSPASFASRPSLLRHVLPLAASFALGASVATLVQRNMAPSPEPPRILYLERPAAVPAPEQQVDLPAATPPERAAPPEASASRAAPSQNQFAAERRLLDLARGALEREDPAALLAATGQHEKRYPNGILSQEREAMAIRGLMMLGQRREARERATRFGVRFPDSVLLPSIESIVGGPSSQ
jgi:hypothetical protein